MLEWFAQHYGTTTAEDRDANRQRMAADWHPSNCFDPSSSASSPVRRTPTPQGIRSLIATSLALGSASSSDAGCARRSTRAGSPERPPPPASPRRSTRSRRFGRTRSRSSTRRQSPQARTAMEWLRSTTTTQWHRTANPSPTLRPRTPPPKSRSRPKARQSWHCRPNCR
jgi:hypothetical protein